MAYPTVNGPYGLLPYNLVGGRVEAGSTRMYPIASGATDNLNYGDLVLLSSGTLVKTNYTAPSTTQAAIAGVVGVFLGCEYSTPTGVITGKNRYQNWVGGTVASDAVAYICDDPQQVFKACCVVNNGTGTSTALAAFYPVYLGTNLQYVANYSSTVPKSGNSSAGLAASSTNQAKVTGAAPFRVVQFVQESALVITSTLTVATSATQTPASMANIYPGMLITGSGVAANTYVVSVTATQFVASASFTSVANAVYTFTGYPEVLVAWNFGNQAYTNATGT